MGLDYRYFLYFPREHLWHVLQEVLRIAVPHDPPVNIRFPDHLLSIPLDSWSLRDKEPRWDDPEFSFSTVLKFPADEALQDYIDGLKRYEAAGDRNPPAAQEEDLVQIGYIYLTIFQQIPDYPRSDLVLFDFATPGTRMSQLFYESPSIRQTFLALLEKHQGICGVFNNEVYGDVFWFKGKECSLQIDDPYLPPDQIENQSMNPP